ncbi:hypothetical protein HYX08_05345 [Candidatus Woesearchaeota archaeon]|nr:hypothetical protein [Candidatus Woesearchaeota archaeon]
MREQKTGAPVFVKVDEYKEILDVLDMIKDKIKEIRGTLGSINSLRNEEDAELAMWNNTINEIEKKIEGIDRIMFEPEQAW